MAAETEAAAAAPIGRRRVARGGAGPDRVTVLLVSLAVFFVLLAVLARQYTPTLTTSVPHRVVVVRRVYQTTVIEKVPPHVHAVGGVTSSAQAVSGSAAPLPTTRTS